MRAASGECCSRTPNSVHGTCSCSSAGGLHLEKTDRVMVGARLKVQTKNICVSIEAVRSLSTQSFMLMRCGPSAGVDWVLHQVENGDTGGRRASVH